jgi:hypothetical protein
MVPQFTERMQNEIDLAIMDHHLEGGYVEGQAVFYVSLEYKDQESNNVTDNNKSTWDAHWHNVNEEFEDELESSRDSTIWSFRGKMFHVLDGNTCTIAWLAKFKK